jgi:hypothetical protein
MTLTFDEAGARYYETGVSRGILFPIDGSTGVPWNGLTAVNMDPSGGEYEAYFFDGIKYMDRVLAEQFQATIQAINTPKEFRACEGVREYAAGVMTNFNKRDKFHMSWRTEIGSDAGESVGYKIHVAYNCLVQPSSRAYQTIADTVTLESRSFVITATPACGRHSYFWFDSREYDLSALEAQLYAGTLPKCWELAGLVTPVTGGGGGGGTVDPDAGCESLLTDLEQFNYGQILDDDITATSSLVHVYGVINNGLEVNELPAGGAFAANDSAASEVGTHPVLVDDDDATYITSADGDLGYTVGLPPLVGYVEGATLELHIRMSISGGVNADDPDNLDADAQVHISTDATGDLTIGGFSDGEDEGMGFALTSVDGTPVDYVVPLNMDAWVGQTVDDVVTALEAGAYLNVVAVSNNNADTTPTVNVYEAKVVMLDATETSKSLRAILPASAYIESHIYETGTTDVTASNTVSIDFKVNQRVYSSDANGDVEALISWDDLTTKPGSLKLELDTNDPVLNWYDHDPGTLLATLALDTDVWYRAWVDWSWTDCRVRVAKRDELGTVLMDNTHAVTVDPVGYVKNWAGEVGNTEVTYEVSIDNAKMQIHCNDLDPHPGPPAGDYELIIAPTSVTSEGSADSRHSPWIVGTASTALIDGSDSSYGWATWLRTLKGVYPLWTAVDVNAHSYEAGDQTVLPTSGAPIGFTIDTFDPAWITEIGTRFRAKAQESDAIMIPALFGNVGKFLAGKGAVHTPLSFAAADTWENFEYFWSTAEYDTTGWAPDGMASALAITSYLYTRTWPLNPSDHTLYGDYNIQVSEQYLVIRFTIP